METVCLGDSEAIMISVCPASLKGHTSTQRLVSDISLSTTMHDVWVCEMHVATFMTDSDD